MLFIGYVLLCLAMLTQSFSQNVVRLTGESGSGSPAPIVVYSSGMRNFLPNDVALQFIVAVQNSGDKMVRVGLEMERCCQLLSPQDMDCESIVLHSGLRVQLHSQETRNLSMFYVNWYLNERSGHCWIKVHYNYPNIPGRGLEVEKIKIDFDTRIHPPSYFTQILNVFRNPKTVLHKCKYFDQDPKRNCAPVNCVLKYSGFRSFYNSTLNKCQPTPSCLEQDKNGQKHRVPHDVLLSKKSNKCKNIKTDIPFSEELTTVKDVVETSTLSFSTFPLKVECVHGKNQTNSTGGWLNCTCLPGWTSTPINNKTFNPMTDTLVLCNIRTQDGQHFDQAQMASFTFLTLLGVLAIVVIILCILLPYLYRNYGKKKSEYSKVPEDEDNNNMDFDEDEESEMGRLSGIMSKREITTTPTGSKATPNKSELLKTTSQSESKVSKGPSNQTSGSDVQLKQSIYSKFPKSIECLTTPKKKMSSFMIPSSSTSSHELLSSMSTKWLPGLSMSADQFAYPRRMGSSCDCCDNMLLEPVLKVNVISNTSKQSVSLSKATDGNDNTNINIVSEYAKIPECTEQGFTKELYAPEFEEELDELIGDVSHESLPSARESLRSNLTEYWVTDEDKNQNEENKKSKGSEKPNWAKSVWD